MLFNHKEHSWTQVPVLLELSILNENWENGIKIFKSLAIKGNYKNGVAGVFGTLNSCALMFL